MTTYTIYTLSKNGIPFYVGCTRQPETRYPASNRKEFEAIETTTDNAHAIELESFWIAMFRSWGFQLKNYRLPRLYQMAKNYDMSNPADLRAAAMNTNMCKAELGLALGRSVKSIERYMKENHILLTSLVAVPVIEKHISYQQVTSLNN